MLLFPHVINSLAPTYAYDKNEEPVQEIIKLCLFTIKGILGMHSD